MIKIRNILNCAVGALFLFVTGACAQAQNTDRIGELLELLATEDLPNWQLVENELQAEWAKSGSPSADLLLRRGRTALDENDIGAAIEHFTAVIDHAPGFAEGYNMRATAYFHAGLFGPALGDIEVTLSLNPDHYGALTGLGMIMQQLDAPDKAFEALSKAASIHPHDPDLQKAVTQMEQTISGTSL